jgi:hypothetical protein
MGRYIVKIRDRYLEWSTVTDSPASYGMDRESFVIYYRQMYGEQGMDGLRSRLERADLSGISAFGCKRENLFTYNRAGDNETTLTEDEIYQKYCT